MSEQELIGLIRKQLDDETDISSPRQRVFKTAQRGNNIFAENIGRAVYQYLDDVYFQRITDYITETYEERIKKLEDEVKALKAKVK